MKYNSCQPSFFCRYSAFIIPIAAALIIILLSGCSSAPKSAAKDDLKPPTAVIAGEMVEITSFHGRGSMTSVWEGRQNPTVQVSYATFRDDSLVMSVQTFGILMAKLQSNPDRLTMYEVAGNKAYISRPDKESFQRLIKIPLEHKEFVRLLQAAMPAAPEQYTVREEQGDSLVFQRREGAMTEQVVLDKKDGYLKSCVRKLDGEFVLIAQYSQPKSVQGRKIPHSVNIRFPANDSRVTVELSSIEFNKPGIRYSFTVPNDAKIEEL